MQIVWPPEIFLVAGSEPQLVPQPFVDSYQGSVGQGKWQLASYLLGICRVPTGLVLA